MQKRKSSSEYQPVVESKKVKSNDLKGPSDIRTSKLRQPRNKHEEQANVVVEYRLDKESGVRSVEPYLRKLSCHAKRRWLGRALIDVYKAEFCCSESPEYYQTAIESGTITVNGVKVDCEYIIRDLDCIVHEKWHTEPAIPYFIAREQVLIETADYLIIDKPCGVPVHPAGRYRYNTVTEIFGRGLALGRLFTVHRLDRLTSGVLVLAKKSEMASSLSRIFTDSHHLVEKVYLALVQDNDLIFKSGDFIEVDEPLGTVDHKLCLNTVDRVEGKPAKTRFRRLRSFTHTDFDKVALIECLPLSGRTHQIRVHLRWLGCPIVNDPIYTDERLFQTDDELIAPEEMKRRSQPLIAQQQTDDCTRPSAVNQLHLHAWKLKIAPVDQIDIIAPLPDWAIPRETLAGN